MTKRYVDDRPYAKYRMDATDEGRILTHGDSYDILCSREAIINEEDGKYYLFYDGATEEGWHVCLAESDDLLHWEKKGPILEFGKEGDRDSYAAVSPWVFYEDGKWHMFYIGAPNGKEKKVPAPPYYTLCASSEKLAGPYTKREGFIPFDLKPDSYYSATASSGHIIKHEGEYLMFFSASFFTDKAETKLMRTVSIARTKDLEGKWTPDEKSTFPLEEQIENTSVYYEKENGLWFMFTNHIGTLPAPEGSAPTEIEHEKEFTDGIWVYWTDDPNNWNPDNKAVVLDGENCTWSKACIGLPTVVPYGDKLAIFYDAPGGDSLNHLERDLGLCWLDLPLQPPVK